MSMLQAAAVVFLLALFSSHAHAEPGDNQTATEAGARNALVAVAEVGPPPQDVGEELKTWDRIKRSNDVSELEALIARHKDTFLANLARRRIEQLGRQGVVRPGLVQAPN
jgi:hypothetical protein